MIELNNVTLVCVACVRLERAVRAIELSTVGIKYKKILLFTNEEIKSDVFETIKIEKLDYNGYNKFIVYELGKYIDSEYVLIIQDDGFVVNNELWQDSFLSYDYIGAPWPKNINIFSDNRGNLVRVGNGGFSIRSKKLLDLAKNISLKWKDVNEDYFICCLNRHVYEQNGITFAPIEIAKYFSHEINIPETKNIKPFGFHSNKQEYYYNI